MAVGANKRSIMTLYSISNDMYNQRVQIVLAEKGVNVETIHINPRKESKELMTVNPTGKLPTLVDRDLVLYDSMIIMEYLDERFPHPPLLPVYPVARAKSRLLIHQIERDWYSAIHHLENGTDAQSKLARKKLQEYLTKAAPLFAGSPFFLSEEFSMVDCSLAPLFWHLSKMGMLSTQAKSIRTYAEQLFKRASFRASLTEAELQGS